MPILFRSNLNKFTKKQAQDITQLNFSRPFSSLPIFYIIFHLNNDAKKNFSINTKASTISKIYFYAKKIILSTVFLISLNEILEIGKNIVSKITLKLAEDNEFKSEEKPLVQNNNQLDSIVTPSLNANGPLIIDGKSVDKKSSIVSAKNNLINKILKLVEDNKDLLKNKSGDQNFSKELLDLNITKVYGVINILIRKNLDELREYHTEVENHFKDFELIKELITSAKSLNLTEEQIQHHQNTDFKNFVNQLINKIKKYDINNSEDLNSVHEYIYISKGSIEKIYKNVVVNIEQFNTL